MGFFLVSQFVAVSVHYELFLQSLQSPNSSLTFAFFLTLWGKRASGELRFGLSPLRFPEKEIATTILAWNPRSELYSP